MTNLDLKKITEDLIETFLKAGQVAKDISKSGLKITIKSDNTPVTNGDLEVDLILRSKIGSLTPKITIISEETVDINVENKERIFWLIDPIDGTRDYISKKEEYTLNAALIVDLKPAIGIIYAPEKERLFFSYGPNLAFELSKGKRKKLNCKKNFINEIVGLENFRSTPPEVVNIYKKYNVSRTIKMSSSFKFCTLAAGEADIYAANARAFEWDIAAGHAILEHAGGNITDHHSKNFLYGKKNYKNISLIAKRSKNLNQ
ncbi:MAG: 3'(2'), 5'-bisphosphate nucleotidase [Pelagibacterales bacterium]|nr:3'(2'), 5'-bisphosphate nucleotidase [Pelagibacterales bacterium]